MSSAGTGGPPDRVLVMSRKRSARLLAIALVFVTIGVVIVVTGPAAFGWVVIVFFGLGLLVFGAELIKPSTLELTSSGFTLRRAMPPRATTRTWSQCRNFTAFRVAYGVDQVVYTTDLSDRAKLRRVNRSISSGDESGPTSGFGGMTAGELADLMNSYQKAFARA